MASTSGAVVLVVGDTGEAAELRRRLGALAWAGDPAEAVEARVIVDARHPFDIQPLSFAGARPLVRLFRPPWRPLPGDDWRMADSPEAARAALAPNWRRVLLTLGRDRLGPFENDPDRVYLVRVRGEPAAAPPLRHVEVLGDSGPFTAEGEAALFRARGLDALVTRNDGGEGAFPKIAAARRLRLPVVMVRRPTSPEAEANAAETVDNVGAAVSWVERRLRRGETAP